VAFTVLKPGSSLQRLLELLTVGVGPSGGQFPADGDRLLDGVQRLIPAPQSGQIGRQVIQRAGQVRPERIRAGRGQLPIDAYRFLDSGQRLLPPPQVAQPDRQVVQRNGEAAAGRPVLPKGLCPVLSELLAGESGGERGDANGSPQISQAPPSRSPAASWAVFLAPVVQLAAMAAEARTFGTPGCRPRVSTGATRHGVSKTSWHHCTSEGRVDVTVRSPPRCRPA
jgi:hypothetical protein